MESTATSLDDRIDGLIGPLWAQVGASKVAQTKRGKLAKTDFFEWQ